MKRWTIVLSALVIFLLTACAGTTEPTATVEVPVEKVCVPGGCYTNVRPAELHSMLEKKDFTLVNVHIPFEGNIAKTDLSIAYDQIEQNLDKLPNKDAKIVLYCRSGRMSGMAAEILVGLGYTNVWNLSDGMVDWEKAGYTIER